MGEIYQFDLDLKEKQKNKPKDKGINTRVHIERSNCNTYDYIQLDFNLQKQRSYEDYIDQGLLVVDDIIEEMISKYMIAFTDEDRQRQSILNTTENVLKDIVITTIRQIEDSLEGVLAEEGYIKSKIIQSLAQTKYDVDKILVNF